MALAKRTYSPDAGGEIQALLNLMDRVDLDWVSVKAEALHAKELFLYLEVNFMVTVKHSHPKGDQLIRDRLTEVSCRSKPADSRSIIGLTSPGRFAAYQVRRGWWRTDPAAP